MKTKIGILFAGFFVFICFGIVDVNAENNNIIAAYKYNETNCIQGESTCEKTTCYNNETANSCEPGTIIEYKVNDTTTKLFHVLYDDGNTMTLYENSTEVKSEWWYEGNTDIQSWTNSKGPVNALVKLREYTSGWKNVNDITYQMSITKFFDNSFTKCDSEGCTENSYIWTSPVTAKARMITVQEAMHLGCNFNPSSQTCPLYLSTNIGTEGIYTMNGTGTMGALFLYKTNTETNHAYLQSDAVGYERELRAVVVVNKNLKNSESSNDTKADTSAATNTNDSQTVKVDDTAMKASFFGYCAGLAILVMGTMVIYQSAKKTKKEEEK